ncbi:zinc-ribbon domain-containing protein [Pararhodobacter sp. CCB-MM2]|uniref:zinc-ribbon domain-containing protein n=1 Tax=Pararhodobacter sp. CCB-MM2 TaxID=1786003 RepID=UPI000833F3F6|nr:zinc-ribbon domain-containing protein [Pararhodobacter sp. CCB-MM2]MCA2012661.1 zinc-ribbon domain-containing protein [Cereibacter sphaeroides]
MRLTCPNCSAQYEVDEAVIPKGGRDVQCSACGHTWYQYHKDVALAMRAAELDDDDEDEDDLPAVGDGEGGERPVGMAERAAPRIDKTVLDVLREEAEREMGERKRAQTGIETQGELGLSRPSRPSRSKAAPSRVFGEDDPTPPPPEDLPDDEADAPEEPVSRRKLLPDIEELTSTLEPGSERRDDDDDLDGDEDQRGFRRGLSVAMLIALALVVLYLLAPILANAVPALADPLAGYMSLVDGLRASIANTLRGLLGG